MPYDNATGQSFLGSSRNPFSYEKVEQISRNISTSWLTLTEIQNQLNLFGDTSQNTYLSSIELATRMAIEDYLGMSILTVQYKVYYGSTNTTGTQMSLDLPEVSQDGVGTSGVTINSVGYWNANTPPVFVTVNASEYFYDPTGNKVIVNGIPNEVSQVITNPIVVTYTLNANPIGQYPVIKQAGLLLLTHIYNNRSDTSTSLVRKIPFGVEALLRPYKPLVL